MLYLYTRAYQWYQWYQLVLPWYLVWPYTYEAYAAIKAAKYADQPNFVPFFVETGGYINRRAHLFLDTLRGSQGSRPAADSRTQGYFRGPSPQDVALRGVMKALVRIQAYMLADIVVAIPAVDLAIEAVV
jgi:hypothetical protein